MKNKMSIFGRLKHQYWRVCSALLCLMAFSMVSAPAAKAQFSEYEIKAALCYNFAKYVDWSEKMFKKGSSTLVLGIYGTDPFGSVIDNMMRGRVLKGKYYVEVRRISTLKEFKDVHIVFVGRSEQANIKRVLEHIRQYAGASVLTIGDGIPDFCKMGGMINILDDYTFQLNLGAFTNAGLVIDNKLINIAAAIVPSSNETGN
jgi:hypothetical protein